MVTWNAHVNGPAASIRRNPDLDHVTAPRAARRVDLHHVARRPPPAGGRLRRGEGRRSDGDRMVQRIVRETVHWIHPADAGTGHGRGAAAGALKRLRPALALAPPARLTAHASRRWLEHLRLRKLRGRWRRWRFMRRGRRLLRQLLFDDDDRPPRRLLRWAVMAAAACILGTGLDHVPLALTLDDHGTLHDNLPNWQRANAHGLQRMRRCPLHHEGFLYLDGRAAPSVAALKHEPTKSHSWSVGHTTVPDGRTNPGLRAPATTFRSSRGTGRVGVDTYLSRCRHGRAGRVLRVGRGVGVRPPCGRGVGRRRVGRAGRGGRGGVWCTACGRVRRATWSPSRLHTSVH